MTKNFIDIKTEENFSETMEMLFYQNSNEKEVLRIALSDLLMNQRFKIGLDIGAGPGLLSQPLYDHCDHLTLLDIDSTHKSSLKTKFPNATIAIESFLTFNVNQKFDLIHCSHTLYYFNSNDLKTTLAKMYSMLNKNGILIIILLDTQELLKNFSPKLSHLFRVTFIPIKLVTDFLQSYPGQIECHPYENKKIFSNEDELTDYLQFFFTLESKEPLIKCDKEIVQLKQTLERQENRYVMPQMGKIIVYKK